MREQKRDTTENYFELASDGYALVLEAATAANGRALNYFKAVSEVAVRPLAFSTLEAAMRDGFDRAQQVANLTADEMQQLGRSNTELAEKVTSYSGKLQETLLETLRGAVRTGLSNLAYAKETADAQIEGLAKRVEEIQTRTAAVVSSN